MKIMGVDVGKNFGISVMEDGGFVLKYGSACKDLKDFYEQTLFLAEKFKPIDAIICGKPNGFYRLIQSQMMYIGVARLIADTVDSSFVIVSDNTARKEILGQGNGRNKDMVHVKYSGPTPDASDACLFAEYLYRAQ